MKGCCTLRAKVYIQVPYTGAHPKRAKGTAWLQPPTNQNLRKNTDFVVIMLSNILHDLPFSQNQPLKLAMTSTLEF